MLKSVAERWKAWRDPQARNARKKHRRREWNEAHAAANSRRQTGPSPTNVYTRGFKDTKH
jgi:hypothetical protein